MLLAQSRESNPMEAMTFSRSVAVSNRARPTSISDAGRHISLDGKLFLKLGDSS